MNKKNKFLIYGSFILITFSILFFLQFVSPLITQGFNNSLSSENLTFTGDENITRYLDLFRTANVTSAVMNLSGYFDGVDSPISNETFSGDTTGSYTNNNDFTISLTASDFGFIARYDISTTSTTGSHLDVQVSIIQNSQVLATQTLNLGAGGTDSSTGGSGRFSFNMDDYSNLINPGVFTIRTQRISFSGTADIARWTHSNSFSGTTFEFNTQTLSGRQSGSGAKIIRFTLVDIAKAPTNPFINLNSTQIWNHVGEFNETHSPSQTSDFSSTLNTALGSSCSGGEIVNNYCRIPFIFHSDTAGILQYSDINITYSALPITNLQFPVNNSNFNTTEIEFSINVSDVGEVGIKNVTFEIYNSTGLFHTETNTSGVEGIYNLTVINFVDGLYNWTVITYDNNNESGKTYGSDDTRTLEVDTTPPTIDFVSPTENNGTAFNRDWIAINVTATDESDNLDTIIIKLFNSTYDQINLTTTSTSPNFINFTNLDEGIYYYNATANDTFGNENSTETRQLHLDLSAPQITLDAPSTTEGSLTFSFNSTATDLNLNTCLYSLFDSDENIEIANTTYTCNSVTSVTATKFGAKTLRIYANDTAGNTNTTSRIFSMSTSIAAGGGGGGGVIIIEPETNETMWSFETDVGTSKYELQMSLGTSRTRGLLFENLGETSQKINILCEPIPTFDDLCAFVEFEESQFDLSPTRDLKIRKDFTITLTDNVERGNYVFNLVAIDEKGRSGLITMQVKVGGISPKVIEGIQKLFDPLKFIIFLIIASFISALSYFTITQPVFKGKGFSVNIILSLVISFIIVIILL